MRLNNLRFPGETDAKDLLISNGRITAVLPGQSPSAAAPPPSAAGHAPDLPDPTLDFHGALVFPGLINSHDHLDFNLFPRLGNRTYQNYREWGPDIHTNNTAAIKAVLRIPQSLRTRWGLYKNLLNGFTTVVNHGEKLVTDTNLIHVFQDCYSLHSVGFERHWKWKLNRPGAKRRPFALHVGEGTDNAAAGEIDQLLRWNLFKRPVIGIHGVAMNERQAAAFRALVWCPASNDFLLNSTAPIDRLKYKVPLLFGTDSTLTADWNAWTQIRMGRNTGLATDRELLDMLTTAPAAAWRLKDRGTLAAGRMADLVIARPKPGQQGMEPGQQGMGSGQLSLDAFYNLDPADILLVLHEGSVRLFDPALIKPLTALGIAMDNFSQTKPGGKYVSGDLPGLMRLIRSYYPEVVFPPLP
jgi:cytosine/adenosine deaminase-related metal-dependent hydrolase